VIPRTPSQQGAFATPTLRGAARRPAFLPTRHRARSDAAIDCTSRAASAQGADPKIIDPALKKITLSADERGPARRVRASPHARHALSWRKEVGARRAH